MSEFVIYQGTVEVYDEEACDYLLYEDTGFFVKREDAQAALDAIVKPSRPEGDMVCEITSLTVHGDVVDLGSSRGAARLESGDHIG